MPSEPTIDLESMDIAAVAATFAITSPSQEKFLSGVPAEPFFAVDYLPVQMPSASSSASPARSAPHKDKKIVKEYASDKGKPKAR